MIEKCISDIIRGLGLYFSEHIPYPNRQRVLCTTYLVVRNDASLIVSLLLRTTYLGDTDDSLPSRERKDTGCLDLECHSHSLVRDRRDQKKTVSIF